MEIRAGVPTIPIRCWERERRLVKMHTPRAGLNVRLVETPDGTICIAETGPRSAHAWELTFRFDDKRGWLATVRPGFVNGRNVTISDTDAEGVMRAIPLTAETPPEIAFADFRNPAVPGSVSVSASEQLLQGAGEGYPDFFADLGAVPPAKAGKLGDTSAQDSAPTRTREIRACDLVLVTPRIAVRQQLDVSNPLATAQSVTIQTTFTNDAIRSAESPHWLTTVAKWEPPHEPSPEEKFFGTYEEPQTDELLIATVYFLAPEDGAPDPDGSWEPYPLYRVFWNLAHASRAIIREVPSSPIRLDLPLAGGIAQQVINGLLSLVNDADSQIAALLSSTNFAGMYWNPGGLGFDKFPRPVAAAKPARTGLDPKAARLAKPVKETPPLNPPFPYKRTPFDPFFFELQRAIPKGAAAGAG